MSRENSPYQNPLSELRRIQLELEADRRQRRNKEVDELIRNIGDPRIAEKLRIYRLVEEKFSAVEQQVENEVKQELAKKKSSPNPEAKKPMGLQDVERYLKKHSKQPRIMQDLDLVPTRLPKTPSSKQTSQPGVFIKYRPVPLSSIDAPKAVNPQHLTAYDSDGIVVERKPVIKDKPIALKFQTARRQPVSKPEKVSPASKRQARKPPPNVGLVDYVYQDVDYRRRQWMKLSAHLLQGVDIKPDPKRPANHLVRTLIDSADHKVFISTFCLDNQNSVSDEPDLQNDPPRSTSVLSDRQRIQTIPDKMSCSPKEKSESEKFFDDGSRLSRSPVQFSDSLPVVRDERSLEQLAKVSVASQLEVKSHESRSSSSYSMEFEDEEPEGGVIEQNPIFLDEFHGSMGSITDRLSTIPEDSRSHELEELENPTPVRIAEVQSLSDGHQSQSSQRQNDLLTGGTTTAADLHTFDKHNFGEDQHDAVTSVAQVDQDDKVTNPSFSYLKDVGNMTITQSAKSMLDMLDELSMSEGLLSDISLGQFEPNLSHRTNQFKPEFESRSPVRPKTSKPNSKATKQAPSSSSHSTSNSSAPLYSSSTSYTSATTSMEAELSEGQVSLISSN